MASVKNDFLSQFMGNATRARLLRILILNEHEVFTPARLAKRARISLKTATQELAGLRAIELVRTGKAFLSPETTHASARAKKKALEKPEKVWFLDPHFRHFGAVSAFVQALSPMEHEEVLDALKRSGKLSAVILSGFFVGDFSRPADILVAGERMNERHLEGAMKALEPVFGRELRYAAFTTPEFRYRLTVQDRLIRDTLDFPHVVLLDRAGLL